MNSFTDSLEGPLLWAWTAFVVVGFIGSMLFPVLYHFGSRGQWRRGVMGRHLMAFSMAVGYALLAYLLRIVLGEYPGRALVNFSAMFALVGVVWWRSGLYVWDQRQQRKERGRDLV